MPFRTPMSVSLTNPVKYLRGVGPQRAAALEERGIATVGDLLGYLPFRYEDRIRFTPIAEIVPGQVQTILAEVANGGGSTVRFRRGRGPVFHVTVRDGSGSLHARFFHGAYLEGRLKEGQRLVMHGKADVDPYRPGRLEMVNPQIEIAERRQRARGFDRSRAHRADLRSHRRNQFAHAAADHLRRAAQFRRKRSRSASRRNSPALSLPDAPRGAAERPFPAQGREPRAAEQLSEPRADAADFRGVFLLPDRAGAAPRRATIASAESPCAFARRRCGRR